MSDIDWRKSATNEMLLKRALMLKSIRAFFDDRGVIEVETPVLARFCTTDPHLDSLQTHFRDHTCYLNTSPEYAMKRLLASWGEPVFQICKAFRDDELGPFHNPEFTLLEWYRPGFSQQQLMVELEHLVLELGQLLSVSSAENHESTVCQFQRVSYQQAFEDSVGLNPHVADTSQCYGVVKANNIEIPQGLGLDDSLDAWLDWILVQLVAPSFQHDGFTFLYDYPASQCALAKLGTNPERQQVAKRFELFYGELELANGFDELTDAQEQQSRFRHENARRADSGKSTCELDSYLIAALEHGIQDCAGVALGLDRLLMVLAEESSIDKVLAFPWSRA